MRVQAFTVTFERDLDETEAHRLRVAIHMLRDVLSVDDIVVDPNDHVARQRARREIGEKLWDVVCPPAGAR